MVDATPDKSTEPNQPPRRLIQGLDEIREHLAVLAEQAQRDISLFAPQLYGYLFNTARLTRALASFAARHRHNQVRILVEDAAQVMHDNTRIVELRRQLSAFVNIRQVGEEHRGMRDMFFVVDRRCYLHQQDVTKPSCLFHTHDVPGSMALISRFDKLWERSEAIAELHTTGL